MSRPQISVITVTYNSGDHVARALTAVRRAAEGLQVQTVVVDNGSQDDTVEQVRSALDVVLVTGHGNVGFARGCSLGASRAQADLLLFLNPDTELRPEALRNLLSGARAHAGAGIWGGRTLRPDGRVERTCAQGAITVWSLTCFALGLSSLLPENRLFDPESLGPWSRDTLRTVPMLSGAVLALSRRAWDDLDGFDAAYFMYAEDADLCRRAWQRGWRPTLLPDVEAVHLVGGSSTGQHKQVLLQKGKVTYIRRHFGRLTARYGVACLLLGVGLRAALAGAASSVRRSDRRRSAPSSWRAAWAQREAWRHGW